MTRLILLLPLLFTLLASPAYSAAIQHAFTEVNTAQSTTSGTYVDVPGASIADGSLTDGKKYLVYITALMNENSSSVSRIKTVHGSTDFAESEQILAQSTSIYGTYTFMTVWTAVAGEGLKLQFSVGTGDVFVDRVAMMAINLSDDVAENTDWFSAELTTDEGLTTTPDDGASITLTPGTAGHDWLVLSYALFDVTDGTLSCISRIERSGEASSTLPEARKEMASTSAFHGMLLARAFNLGASSNTFKEVSASTGTGNTRLHSRIFAIDLDKFRNHVVAYTEADAALSATNYATNLQTASMTPDVVSDVWIVTYWGFDGNDTTREAESRVQVDDVDQPSGQTTANYQIRSTAGDLTDEEPLAQHTMVTAMSAAAHTIDLDASSDATTNNPAGQQRFTGAVTMELAAVGGAVLQSSPVPSVLFQ